MRIPSGVTDQYIYFVAVDSTDYVTRETGLTTFTVYRSRDGAAAAAMTTPTVNETDATNMPGVYELLLDEDMTIGSGNDSEEMVFHITKTGMAPVTRTIELYRPKITAGNTLDVTATGAAGIDWGNIENKTTSVDLSATSINLCDTITTYTGNTVQTGDSYARLGAPVAASISADIAVVDGNVDSILTDTGTTLQAELDAIQAAVITNAAGVDIAADIIAIKAETANILTDTGTTIPGTIATVDANVDAILVDTGTTIPATITTLQADTDDIQTRLPAALVGGRMNSDVQALNSDNTAAANIALSAATIVGGACEGTPSTTVIQTNLAEASDDVYIGRILIFTSGAASGEATDITDYVGATGTVTVTPLAFAPAAADTFILI